MGVNANLPRDHGIHHLLCFRGLKMLTVEDCKLSTLFTYSLAKTNLQQLEVLIVQRCIKMEELVRDENEGNMKLMADAADEILSCEFPRLKRIEMGDLPVLKSFCGSVRYTFNMPSLQEVVLRDCPLMRNFTCRQLTTSPKFTITGGDKHHKECTDLNKYLQTLLVNRSEGDIFLELEMAKNSDDNQDNTEDDADNNDGNQDNTGDDADNNDGNQDNTEDDAKN